jgi:hypothetical protein
VTRDPNAAFPTPFGPVTATSTLVPTVTSTLTLTATLAPDTATPLTPLTPTPILARPLYTIYATVDYDSHHVAVDQAITYPNLTGITLNEIVLAVEPMLYGNAFYLSDISVNGAPVTN